MIQTEKKNLNLCAVSVDCEGAKTTTNLLVKIESRKNVKASSEGKRELAEVFKSTNRFEAS